MLAKITKYRTVAYQNAAKKSDVATSCYILQAFKCYTYLHVFASLVFFQKFLPLAF